MISVSFLENFSQMAVGLSKAAASLADVIATAALCFYLASSQTGFKKCVSSQLISPAYH